MASGVILDGSTSHASNLRLAPGFYLFKSLDFI